MLYAAMPLTPALSMLSLFSLSYFLRSIMLLMPLSPLMPLRFLRRYLFRLLLLFAMMFFDDADAFMISFISPAAMLIRCCRCRLILMLPLITDIYMPADAVDADAAMF